MGAEILISGRGLPGSRAKSWRFYAGYLKKSGDIAVSFVQYGHAKANLKSGTVGIKVRILPGDTQLPDKITIKEIKKEIQVEEKDIKEVKEMPKEKKVKKKKAKKKVAKKKVKKKVAKKEEKKEEKIENEAEEQ